MTASISLQTSLEIAVFDPEKTHITVLCAISTFWRA
jgi:hypothetical protein